MVTCFSMDPFLHFFWHADQSNKSSSPPWVYVGPAYFICSVWSLSQMSSDKTLDRVRNHKNTDVLLLLFSLTWLSSIIGHSKSISLHTLCPIKCYYAAGTLSGLDLNPNPSKIQKQKPDSDLMSHFKMFNFVKAHSFPQSHPPSGKACMINGAHLLMGCISDFSDLQRTWRL